MELLFVCTGNICRSPIAERLSVMLGQRMRIPKLSASSAGTHALISHPMHPEAAAVLTKLGGESSDFAARQITARIAESADLILAMTVSHRDYVLGLAPRMLRRTYTLAEAAKLASMNNARTIADLHDLRPHLAGCSLGDVSDPIGGGPEVFAAVGSQIAELLPFVLQLASSD